MKQLITNMKIVHPKAGSGEGSQPWATVIAMLAQ
ncbi:hypothetical protein FHW96_000485 [Novosphingobium sp. SG751A]|jgi:hypothetical protein|nr:hypothetical protein [Novosphingobium sp. SG751A]